MKRLLIPILSALIWSLSSCQSGEEQKVYTSGNRNIDSTLATEAQIEAIIQPYRDSMDALMSEVLLEIGNDLEKDRDNGGLGYWMCDLMLLSAEETHGLQADIALLNHGGVRRPYIKKGKLTRGMVYEMMPFDNQVVVLLADSAQVMGLAQEIVKREGAPLAGMHIQETERGLNVEVAGAALAGREYTLLCSDYQYNGGDQYGFLQSMSKQRELGLVRDALLDGIDLLSGKAKDSIVQIVIGRRVELVQ